MRCSGCGSHFGVLEYMKNSLISFVIIVVLFAAAFLGGKWLQKKQSSEVIQVERIQPYTVCDPSLKACKFKLDSHSVSFEFLQQASALKPFSVAVKTDINNLQQVGLRFYMQGMSMGYNTFELQPIDGGQWKADIVLPVCSTGSKDWHVELQLLFDNNRLLISDFYFKQTN